jgi:hypothetical protein
VLDFVSVLLHLASAFGVISSSEDLHKDLEVESKSRKIMERLHQSRVSSTAKKEKE